MSACLSCGEENRDRGGNHDNAPKEHSISEPCLGIKLAQTLLAYEEGKSEREVTWREGLLGVEDKTEHEWKNVR